RVRHSRRSHRGGRSAERSSRRCRAGHRPSLRAWVPHVLVSGAAAGAACTCALSPVCWWGSDGDERVAARPSRYVGAPVGTRNRAPLVARLRGHPPAPTTAFPPEVPMKIRVASLLLALALPLTAQEPVADQTEAIFYKAYYLEKGQRDFAGAMSLYEQFL